MTKQQVHSMRLILMVLLGLAAIWAFRGWDHPPVDGGGASPPLSAVGTLAAVAPTGIERLPAPARCSSDLHPALAIGAGPSVQAMGTARFALDGLMPASMPAAPSAMAADESGVEFPWPVGKPASEFRDALRPHDAGMGARSRQHGATEEPLTAEALQSRLYCGTAGVEIDTVRFLIQIGQAETVAAAIDKVLSISSDLPEYPAFLAALAHDVDVVSADRLIRDLGMTDSETRRESIMDVVYVLRGSNMVAALSAGVVAARDPARARDCLDLLSMRWCPDEIEALARLLYGGDERVGQAAARGLAVIGGGRSTVILAERASSPIPPPAAAVGALAGMDSSYAQETLLALVQDPACSIPVRDAAMAALAERSSGRVETVLAHHPDAEQTAASAAAAGHAALNPPVPESEPVSPSIPDRTVDGGETWF